MKIEAFASSKCKQNSEKQGDNGNKFNEDNTLQKQANKWLAKALKLQDYFSIFYTKNQERKQHSKKLATNSS